MTFSFSQVAFPAFLLSIACNAVVCLFVGSKFVVPFVYCLRTRNHLYFVFSQLGLQFQFETLVEFVRFPHTNLAYSLSLTHTHSLSQFLSICDLLSLTRSYSGCLTLTLCLLAIAYNEVFRCAVYNQLSGWVSAFPFILIHISQSPYTSTT